MLKYYFKIVQFYETLINLVIVFILNIKYIHSKTIYPKRKYDSIQILGNGPSLINDLPKILATRKNCSIMVVNSFASSKLFEKIKPEYYIVVDPAFFSIPKNERIKKVQNSFHDSIVKKTSWNLNLLIPTTAKNSSFIEEIVSSNSFIKITYFKHIPIIGGVKRLNNFLFTFDLATPFYMNILIAAIFNSLKMRYNKIVVWGADHSWHEDYVLGADNYIYRSDKHFYSKDPKGNLIVLTKADGSPQRVHEEFYNMHAVFKTYHSIQNFSKKIGSKIINSSSKTWIDAFQRIEK